MDIHRSFKIPLKERRPSEDCQYTLPADSREAKEIEHIIKRQTWDTNDLDRAVSISLIKKVDNPSLEKEYREKKSQLREEGRSLKELTQQLAFCLETDDNRVKEICQIGLECSGADHTLGDGGMGVTVWRCPDLCIRAFNWPASGSAFLLVFKIVKGRVKSVTPRLSPETPNLEPTPNHDCHISRNTVNSSATDLTTLLRSTQYYLYEYDDEGLPSKRPRHCLPFAVIPLKRNEMTSPPSPKRPLICIEKPVSPAKELTKHAEEFKASSFTDDDGILAWRGLVTSGNKSLGRVSLLAGHKLGVNFWKSYLDVSRKLPLRQLVRMLPGDVKSAWKWPLSYRNHTLSVCTMKQAQGEPCETFTSFTRHLAMKAKSAGALCIDSNTTMFLVPSGKLAVHLGFCEKEIPPRMFCIVCRRHAAPLMLSSTCCRTAFKPCSKTPVNNETTSAEQSSLDLKARYTSKIIVSSTENSLRSAPKNAYPRQILKRSLSLSYTPVKNAGKSLQRIFRSASSSEGLGSREETATKPAILPMSEASCDGSKRKDHFACETSHVSDNKSQIAAGSSPFVLNWLGDTEKCEDRNSYMDPESNTAVNVKGCASSLVTFETSPTVSKKATLGHLESEVQPYEPLQLPEVKATCNSLPNLEDNEFSTPTHPLLGLHSRKTRVKALESMLKPPPLEVAFQESSYPQDVPQCTSAVRRDDDFLLKSAISPYSEFEVSRLTSTHSLLVSSSVQGSIQKSDCKEDGHGFSVTDECESGTSLRSDSQARSSVKWACVPTTESTEATPSAPNTNDRNSCVREMASSSSPNREHCSLSNLTTSRSQSTSECLRVTEKESDEMPSPGEEVSCNFSRSSPDNSLSFFARENCFPLLCCTSEDCSLKEGGKIVRGKCSLVHPERYESYSDLSTETAGSPLKANKAFFCVDQEKVIEDSLDKSELQSSCLREDGFNPSSPTKNVPQNHYNSELHDNLQTVDMEISESSTLTNNDVTLRNLKISPDLSGNLPFPPHIDWDLHDNLQSVDMEISETSNLETLHFINGVFSNSSASGAASLREIQYTGWEEKTVTANVKIFELMPSQTVSSQSYPYSPLTIWCGSTGSHSNDLSSTASGSRPFKGDNDVQDRRAEHRLSQRMISSLPCKGSVQQLVSSFSEPSCLASSQPSSNKENAFEIINANTITQTKSISVDPLVTTKRIVHSGGKSPAVDLTTTRVNTFQSHDVDVDIRDDSEVITVACENNNSSENRLDVFDGFFRKGDHSQSDDANSNAQKAAKTGKEIVEETVASGDPSYHPQLKSPKRSGPYPNTSLFLDQSSSSRITEALYRGKEHSMPLSSASDTQTQTIFPKEQESTACGTVLSCNKVSSFSLSPPKSPKVCARKLKMLQDAFKAATDMSVFTNDSRTKRSSPVKVLKNMSRKLSFHSPVQHCKDSHVETSESSDCMGVENSAGSSEKGSKTPVVSSTALENDVTVVPEQATACTGGVIEMSLAEDWGFQTRANDCSEAERRVNSRQLHVDILEAHKAFDSRAVWQVIEDCDIPEPEAVVCSPVAPLETINFRFIRESDFGDHITEDSKNEATAGDTSLVEERCCGVVSELVQSLDTKPPTILSPSGKLVSKPRPSKQYFEDTTKGNGRNTWDSHAAVDSAAVVSCSDEVVPKVRSTRECPEISGKDSLVVDNVISMPGVSEGGQRLYSGTSKSLHKDREALVRSGLVVEFDKQFENCDKSRSLEGMKDALTILPETSGESYLPISEQDTHSCKAEKLCMETFALTRSTKTFSSVTAMAEGNTPIEAELWSSVADKDKGYPKHVTREGFSSLLGQTNDGSLSDGKKERVSCRDIFDEKHATDVAGKEKLKYWSVKMLCITKEKPKEEDLATATESESVMVNCPASVKEIVVAVNATKDTKAVTCHGNTLAVEPENGRDESLQLCRVAKRCQREIPSVKGRDVHHENRAGNRSFDHGREDVTIETADCSWTESNKQDFMTTIREITNNRSSELSSESVSTFPQSTIRVERALKTELKINNPTKPEQSSLKSSGESRNAAKDSRPSDRTFKAVEPQNRAEVNRESSPRTHQSSINYLRRGFSSAKGAMLDERIVREGRIESLISAEIKNGNASSAKSVKRNIDDTRNSNRYAYSSNTEAPHTTTGTLHAYKKLEAQSREAKGTTGDSSVPYKDGRDRTEPLEGSSHLQRDIMVHYTKMKFPIETDQWDVQMLEQRRKRQKMTPPPPLVSLGRGERRDQDLRQTSREAFIENNQLYRPCLDQFHSLFPPVDFIREQQHSRTMGKHRSYPCWAFPQPSLLPVSNKDRAILHRLIPGDPHWCPERAFSPRDPRTRQSRFEQVYPGSPVHGKPIRVPSHCRGQPVLAPPPSLMPGPWALPGIPCHKRYPMYRPR